MFVALRYSIPYSGKGDFWVKYAGMECSWNVCEHFPVGLYQAPTDGNPIVPIPLTLPATRVPGAVGVAKLISCYKFYHHRISRSSNSSTGTISDQPPYGKMNLLSFAPHQACTCLPLDDRTEVGVQVAIRVSSWCLIDYYQTPFRVV